ncbi:MAG: hypothetical protein ACYC1U_02705 [Candidatus Aquicultorales bacterium]
MSDDFFEDDAVEEKQESEKPKKKADAGKVALPKAGAKKAPVGQEKMSFNLGQKIDLTWVLAIAVMAFTIGFVAHAAFFSQPAASSAGTLNTGTGANGGTAPALTEEQLKKYNESGSKLPAGHPNIDGSGSAPTTQTGTGQADTGQGGTGTEAK